MPPTDLAALASLVAAVTAGGATRNPDCRDCLSYAVEIQRAGARFTVSADDTTLGASGVERLVKLLEALLTRGLAGA